MFSKTIVAALCLAVVGCESETDSATVDGFTSAEWSVVQTLSPLPAVPKDTTNAFADDPTAAKLGQRLFFEWDPLESTCRHASLSIL